MHIRTFAQNFLIRFMNHEGTVKQWFSDPEKIAFIRISSDQLKDFPVEIPDENIAIFDFADIELEEWEKNKEKLLEAEEKQEKMTGIRPRFSPITDKEAKEIVEFVLKMKGKGVEVLYIHCDRGESRSPSVAYAIAKYILEDEALADYFDVPFFNINETIIEKIKNAYIEKLKELLECPTLISPV